MAEREVEGVDLGEMEDFFLAFESAMAAAIASTMRRVIRGGAIDAPVDRLSLDDLNVIPPTWAKQIPKLAEDLTEIYVKSANMQADAFARAGGVVTDELVEEIERSTSRAIRRFTSEHQSALDYLSGASNRLAGIGDDLWADARAELLVGMHLGESVDDMARRVQKVTDVTGPRALMIARSEAVSASNSGSIAFMRATGEVSSKRWLCVAGDTPVTVFGTVLAASRRPFRGPLVNVTTEQGRHVSLTPNHEVLTDKGWVRAGDLNRGDQLIQVAGDHSSVAPEVDHHPSLIGEVVDAAMDAMLTEMWADFAGVDFYSNATDAEVEVVWAAGGLLADLESDSKQMVADLDFVSTFADAAAATGLGCGSPDCALSCSTTTISQLNAGLFQNSSDGAGGAAEELCAVGGRLPIEVASNDLIDREVFAAPNLLGDLLSGADVGEFLRGHLEKHRFRSAELDASLTQPASDGLPMASETLRDLSRGFTGLVATDDVVQIEMKWGTGGHVYDLWTSGGWYVCDGLIVHNSTNDSRTRPTHRAADGQTVPLESKYVVGGALMDHPGDPRAPASEFVACRCTQQYLLAPDTASDGDSAATLAASAQTEDQMTATSTEIVTWPEAGTEHELDDDALVAAAMDGMRNVAPFEGVICVAGEATGDRRAFEEFSWSELPIALRRNIEESHGGMPQTVAVLVGKIETLEMRGRELYATGVMDLDSAHGAEAARLMGTREDPGFLRGVSIDGAERPGVPSTVTTIYPAGCADLGEDATADQMAGCMEPQLTIWDHVRVRAATLTDVAAMEGAVLYLTDGASEVPDELERDDDMAVPVAASASIADVVEALVAAAHVIEIADVPPAEWFLEPEGMPEYGAIEITDSGRIFGYVAAAGTAHRAYVGSGRDVRTPMGNVDYGLWQTRARVVEMADGSTMRIATGPITLDCGHASTAGPAARSSHVAIDHYDSSCSLFATACIGENKHGVWIAGALLPDVAPASVARALACQLSGDWRPHSQGKRGFREFCGALLVPVPGLPMATQRRSSVTVQDGALVASATPVRFSTESQPDCGCGETGSDGDTANAARIIAKSVGWDRASRARQIYQSVAPRA